MAKFNWVRAKDLYASYRGRGGIIAATCFYPKNIFITVSDEDEDSEVDPFVYCCIPYGETYKTFCRKCNN